MADKQIHQLPTISEDDPFEPGRDNFVVQKKDQTTSRATIMEMINDPSVNLPGSRNWNWNWLEEPATIVNYHKINYGLPAFSEQVDKNLAEDQLPTSDDIGYPALQNIAFSQDISTGKPTNIPKTVRSLMCVAFVSNCDLYLHGPRSKAVVASERITSFDSKYRSGWNSRPVESVFVINNISFPRDNQEMNDIRYSAKNRLSFQLRFRLGVESFVYHSSRSQRRIGIRSSEPSELAPFSVIDRQMTFAEQNIEGQISKGNISGNRGRLANGGVIGGFAQGIKVGLSDLIDDALDIITTPFSYIKDGALFIDDATGNLFTGTAEYLRDQYRAGKTALIGVRDTIINTVVPEKWQERVKEFSISEAITGVGNYLGGLAGEYIPFVGKPIEGLLSTRTGTELSEDMQLMGELFNDAFFQMEYFLPQGTRQEVRPVTSIAGWELFYIKILAWN
jgi:hypothetical protein